MWTTSLGQTVCVARSYAIPYDFVFNAVAHSMPSMKMSDVPVHGFMVMNSQTCLKETHNRRQEIFRSLTNYRESANARNAQSNQDILFLAISVSPSCLIQSCL